MDPQSTVAVPALPEVPPPFAPAVLHYGDERAEYVAGRNAAVLFDINDRTQIELTGDDRVTFLNNFCTNDLAKLPAGRGCEAFLCNVKGRVLAHVFVFVEDDSLWLETVAGAEDALISHLDRYLITEDVELHRRSDAWGEVFITGPKTFEALQSAGMECDLPEVGSHDCRGDVAGVSAVRFRRVDWFEQPGVLLSVRRADWPALWSHLVSSGVQPGGSQAFHALRISAGFPLYGLDVSDDNLAQEVTRTERAISFTKGCYLGQEPIARIDAMGHVNRELRGLKLERGPAPEPGSAILSPDDGKEIGRITSSVQLAGDAPVALGYVRSRFTEPGSNVAVSVAGNNVAATIFQRLE